MLLKNKNAVIYGAGGSVGRAVAKAFAGAGRRGFHYIISPWEGGLTL